MEILPAWFALHVRRRSKFPVHREITKNGIEVFVPAVTKVRQWKDRKKQITFPLFPGYLFARVLPVSEQFLVLLKTRGVIKILSATHDRRTPIPDTEISALKRLVASDQDLDIYPEVREGKIVRITKGIFENVEGIVSKKDRDYLLHLNVPMLGRCVTVKIPPEDVELV